MYEQYPAYQNNSAGIPQPWFHKAEIQPDPERMNSGCSFHLIRHRISRYSVKILHIHAENNAVIC